MRAGIVTTVFGFSQTRNKQGGAVALWRRVLLLLTLAAFTQAGYLTQTHIHVPVAAGATGLGEHGKSPLGNDPEHCPLCQEYLLAGAYITPAPIVLPLPLVAAFQIVSIARALPFIEAASHDWRGRAPPQD